MSQIGRMLVILGVVIVVVGVAMMFSDRIPWLGRLPGDIVVRRRNVTFYFPVVTAILLSLILTVILNLLTRR